MSDSPTPAADRRIDLKELAEAASPIVDRLCRAAEHNTRWTAYLGFTMFAAFCIVAWMLIEKRQWDLVTDVVKIFGSAVAGYALGAAKKGNS